MPSTLNIFCCYAREDRHLLEKLRKHLRSLERQGFIAIRDDADISGGQVWENEINKYLNTAHIILLLISSDFVNSDYCYSKEMQRAMERHENGETRVIPVLLRPVRWQGTPFGKLQMLPDNARPIISSYWLNEDEAFYDVAEHIDVVVKELIVKYSLNEAEALYDAGRYDGALVLYDQILSREPEQAIAYVGKGKTLFALRRDEEGLQAYERAFQIDPEVADGAFYQEKAQVLARLKRFEESLAAYDEASYRNPRAVELYSKRAEIYLKLQKYQEALSMYKSAIELKPATADYYVQAGDLLLKLGESEQALNYYERAIEREPENIEYYDRKGNLLLHLKRYSQALAIYEKLIDIITKQPDTVETFISYYDKKGKALLELGRYEEALATYEQCIQDYGASDPHFYHSKGKALFGLGRYEEALVAFDKAIHRSAASVDPAIYRDQGATYERLAQQAYALAQQKDDSEQIKSAKREEVPITVYDNDTVVVPAREEGFQKVFLKENRWFAIKMYANTRPNIKYIAAYRVAPQSAITHIAPVSSIEQWDGDPGKVVVNFAEPAREIGRITLLKDGRVKAPQNLRYTNHERLLQAKTLDDIWE